jgi:predicted phosphodiesterase
MKTRSELAADICRKWPNRGNLTLAKALYKKFPDLWPNIDGARGAIRIARGANGKRSRNKARNPSLAKRGYAGQPLPALPHSSAEDWTPFELTAARTLILSDVHLPYHDSSAVEKAIEWGLEHEPDALILNGDICDFFAVSRWLKDPRKIRLKEEIDATIQFFRYVRARFPRARIIWKMGNHEERWEHYLWQKAPELLEVEAFDFAEIFKLPELGIEIVKDQRIIMLGKLPVLHGHEYPKGITNPVNQARGMFIRGLECAIAGHGHRSSEHAEGTLLGKLVTTWSTGCLCNLTPAYARVNKWNWGFAFVESDRTGAFAVKNLRIYAGKVW